MTNHSVLDALREQAARIYVFMLNGERGMAAAHLRQVPVERVPFVVTIMATLAHHEDATRELIAFIEEYTQ